MAVRLQPVQRSFTDLRRELTGNKRGVGKCFKLALAEAIWYWRLHYLPLHFKEGANFIRYKGADYKTKYGIKAKRQEVEGAKNKKTLQEFEDKTGLTVYSRKQLRQFHAGIPLDNSPGVFSGKTRDGMLNGQFKVKGTAKQMRGSWNDSRINWQALVAGRGRLGMGRLADYLLYVNPQEWNAIGRLIEKYFAHYVKMRESGAELPDFSQLPILANN